jgi:hypothetical protein
MEFTKRLALRLKVHNIGGTVVHHVAILKRALDQQKIDCEMVKGFCVIMESKEVCEHYWVRLTSPADSSPSLDLDVAFAVAKLKSPELQALHPVLLESCPQGLNHSDEKEDAIRNENSRLFELFQRDPKSFWHESPRDVAGFRAN